MQNTDEFTNTIDEIDKISSVGSDRDPKISSKVPATTEFTDSFKIQIKNLIKTDKIEIVGKYVNVASYCSLGFFLIGAIGFEYYETYRRTQNKINKTNKNLINFDLNCTIKTCSIFVKSLSKLALSFSLPICLGYTINKYQEKTKIYGFKAVPPYCVLLSIGLLTHVHFWQYLYKHKYITR